ncbi:MMPL family transporter [Dactylosporangium sp. CS-047395]|uniref:MMPL family transporter n=1 Tax=Dactylosporangium sp. CS-047395 TaxID=3239936 RepID=UPI003D936565
MWADLVAGRRGKWVVVAIWAVLLVPALMLAGRLGDAEENDNAAWLPAGAESTAAAERAAKFLPADALPAIVVYDRPGGLTEADVAKARADAEAFARVPGVAGTVQGPLVSDDGAAIQTVVPVHKDRTGWEGIGATVDALTAIGQRDANGLGFHVAGPAGYASDSIKAFGQAGMLTTVTALAVLAILLVTYRSPLLPLLPLLTAGGALAAAEALIFLLAEHAGLTVNKQTSFLLVVLVFGAATDYAMLLISRYREELQRHADRHEAMAEALRRSAPAIVASAATVAVSVLLLMFASLGSTRGMGPACAIGILVGLLAMLTLMPALLVICGRRVFWPSFTARRERFWTRTGDAIARRPRTVWIGTLLVLGAMALGVLGLRANGLSNRDQFVGRTQLSAAEDVQARHFPAGAGDPIVVVSAADTASTVHLVLSNVDGIANVSPPVVKDGEALVLGELRDVPGSTGAMRTVERARSALRGVAGAGAQIGGNTAVALDTQRAAARDDRLIIPIVLLTVLLILALLLRAIVAPLVLIATVVLSFGAALGVSSLVFNRLFAGADASFPLLTFVFLVALGIDYNIFVVTRVREEARRHGTRRGAVRGLAATGGVITSAGFVLAGTFAALGSLPLVFAAELGFAVAFGVLLDTLVVRSVLVTALILDGRFGARFGKVVEPERVPVGAGI